MTDKIAITPGSGADVNTDDCGAAGHVQGMKLCYSADGVATYVTADATGLQVNPGAQTFRIEVNSAGLTTASTSYTAGDQEGTEMTFANAARISGQGGILNSAVLLDKSKILSATPAEIDLLLFTSSITGATDNAAFDDSDTDMGEYVGRVKFYLGDWMVQSSNAINERHGLGIAYACDATSLFGIFVGRTNHTFYTAVTDLRVALTVIRD
jgi:hypothetical protein